MELAKPKLTKLFYLALTGAILWMPALQAQHAMHNMGGDPDFAIDTMPPDDAALASQPESLMLHFGPEVRLVKLAVKDPESSLVDIGFRYNPDPGNHFMQSLPDLEPADFYTVEWAVIDPMGTLTRGNFHFSFGADARPPSYWLEQREEMRHIMAPDYRLLGPN